MSSLRQRSLHVLWGLTLLCAPVTADTTHVVVKPPGYAVASANPLATHAGLEILAAGGNAFDAAVAVSAALAVVEPYHSGLGGGGFWLLHFAKNKKNIFIDGREQAPLAATQDMFLDANGKVITELSLNGAKAAAIPGEPAALVYISKEFGHLPLSKTLAPAIRLAEHGFRVDHHFDVFIKMEDRLQQLKKFPASASIFLKNGEAIPVGERLVQPDLAKTLRLIAEQGQAGFYQGEVARKMVKAVRENGGIWTMNDLYQYRVKIREPLEGTFHNMHIVTAPPPSSGGIALITMLNILSNDSIDSWSRLEWVHYLTEVMRLAYWQRVEAIGDPDFMDHSWSELLTMNHAKHLRRLIEPNRALSSDSLSKKPLGSSEGYHTTHFSILDKEGNWVSATLSINYIFGSSLVAEGTGVLLNDEMDDFTVKPGEQNVFGLIGGLKNVIEPGKRPLSSMTPTFLETPDRIAILGTPGGSRIPSMVLLAALAFDQSYGAHTMVSGMRFHHQYLPDQLMFEPDTFSKAMQKSLEDMGYHLMPMDHYYGDMQAITWDKTTNLITAASDPRHIGQATAVVSQKSGSYGLNH